MNPWVGTLREGLLALWSVDWQHFQIAGDWRDHNEFADGQRKMAKCGVCVDLMGSLDGLCFKLYPIYEPRVSEGIPAQPAADFVCVCVCVQV